MIISETNEMIAAFGEIMLRLTPPDRLLMTQALPGKLEAIFAGSEANVCASLSIFGAKTRYLTALPSNSLSQALVMEQRGFGTDVSQIVFSDTGRLGIFYVENGNGMRDTKVTYDREHSTVSELPPEAYNFQSMLEGVKHLHVSDITPALSENAFKTVLELVKYASAHSITVSCDLNFRRKLWKWDKSLTQFELAGKCMGAILPYADIVFGGSEYAEDIFKLMPEKKSSPEDIMRKLSEHFPNVSVFTMTLRKSFSTEKCELSALLYDVKNKCFHYAPERGGSVEPYCIDNINDRFGGGDAYCAGLLYALGSGKYDLKQSLAFALAASAYKHTIKGDFNYAPLEDIIELLNKRSFGRIQR